MKYWKTLVVGVAAVMAAGTMVMAQNAVAPQPVKPDRMAWWREARFGMFIHWGIYSIPATNDAWYIHFQKMPNATYEKFTQQFNPGKFDAQQWVSLAKSAGMKYLVITSKHHDGFCMFDTKATDYNVMKATPWKHDPLKDISEECRKQGVRFCAYYSIMDWHHPDQIPANDDPEHPSYNDNRMRPGRKEYYVSYMKTQLQELINQYHPGVIWFDGQWPGWWENRDGWELYQWLRKQDPDLIISDRAKGAGDFGTPEGFIPPTGLAGDWETCMTIGKTWGYDKADGDFKSVPALISNIVETVSKGGNYLLNVGPNAEGVIPDQEAARLKALGKWMKVNGEAIYGTTASPFSRLPWGRCSKKITGNGSTLYLMVFNWPADRRLVVPGLLNKVKSASLLATGKKLEAAVKEGGVIVSIPARAPDAACSVIKLEIEGKPEIGTAVLVQRDDPALEAVVKSSVASSSGPENVYDGNKQTKYFAHAKAVWLQFHYESGDRKVESYSLCSANDTPGRDPRDWVLLGSKNGQDWVELDRRTGEDFKERFQRREFQVQKPGDYSYYKLDVTANHGAGETQLSEVELLTAKDIKNLSEQAAKATAGNNGTSQTPLK